MNNSKNIKFLVERWTCSRMKLEIWNQNYGRISIWKAIAKRAKQLLRWELGALEAVVDGNASCSCRCRGSRGRWIMRIDGCGVAEGWGRGGRLTCAAGRAREVSNGLCCRFAQIHPSNWGSSVARETGGAEMNNRITCCVRCGNVINAATIDR